MRAALLGTICAYTLVACAASSYYEPDISNSAAISENDLRVVNFASNLSDGVVFRGDYNLDDLDANHASFLYPGNSSAVFISSVIAHAATSQAVYSGKKREITETANSVLVPYLASISSVNGKAILISAMDKAFQRSAVPVRPYEHLNGQKPPENGASIYSSSVYIVSQDLSQFRLQNAFFKINHDGEATFINVSEVHSREIPEVERDFFWSNSEAISRESEKLLKKSIELVLDDELGLHSANGSGQETVKYFFAGKKNYERGEVLSRDCKNTTIRTLRGWIKYVSSEPNLEYSEACKG
jgi:hypothetical protein